MKPEEKISPAQALDNLYKVTRSVPADANMHEFFAKCRDILKAVITPEPTTGSNVVPDVVEPLSDTTTEVINDEKHDGI
jgi:hypothetical protein